jgi:hypothetical protein
MTSEQFDVYFDFSDSDPYAHSIQCPIGSTIGCFLTEDGTETELPTDGSFRLLSGVLHAYKVRAADLATYVAPHKH